MFSTSNHAIENTQFQSLKSKNLNTVHSNIRSLNKNFIHVELLTLHNNIDLLFLTETWTSAASYIPKLDNYSTHHIANNSSDLSRSNGGIVLYYKPHLNVSLIQTYINDNWQIGVFHLASTNCIFICAYRHPRNQWNPFIECLEAIIEKLSSSYNTNATIILGDINIDIGLSNQSFCKRYLNLMQDNNFIKGIESPTRV